MLFKRDVDRNRLPAPDKFLDYFDKNYKKRLMYRDRWRDYSDRYHGFRKIFAELLKNKQRDFTIIETGSLRTPHRWGDGQSSLLFSDFLHFCGGELISIDVNPGALAVSRRLLRRRVKPAGRAELTLLNGDSRAVLQGLDTRADLVYLDSLDIGPDPYPAMLHALQELFSLRRIIRRSPGLLIAVDDNWDGIGKGRYPLQWARATGQEILHQGYQILFRVRQLGLTDE